MSKREGDAAEAIAAAYLRAQGLTPVARNWRCRLGEIDLICRDGATLVFVEVRRRTRSDYGGARESITFAKRRRIVAAAQSYLAHLSHAPACRFDVILLGPGQPPKLEWLRDAFSAD